jgi:hypothetical protein
MQLQVLLTGALAATASAYRISVYSADSYQGTQRSYVSSPSKFDHTADQAERHPTGLTVLASLSSLGSGSLVQGMVAASRSAKAVQ